MYPTSFTLVGDIKLLIGTYGLSFTLYPSRNNILDGRNELHILTYMWFIISIESIEWNFIRNGEN
jgi:hypothetical protein